MTKPIANFAGIDDGPFELDHRGDVALVATIYTGHRLDGLVTGRARRDGRNSTAQIADMLLTSRFNPSVVLLSGIAVAGFNVIDLHELHERLERPVLTVARRQPDLSKIKHALLRTVPGGARKWSLIQKAGPMEQLGGVWVQRAGLTPGQAKQVLRASTQHGKLPEPLRTAHLIAGGMVLGHSRGGA